MPAKGKVRFVVTAGPTREYLDPVRFLSNPSSGKMGFAVARAAAEKGHEVTLIAGPVSLKTPKGVKRVDVVSAREMLAAVEAEIEASRVARRTMKCACHCTASDSRASYCTASDSRASHEKIFLISTAAVADWRPAKCASKKLKKGEMSDTLKLVRNPDILRTLNRKIEKSKNRKILLVGFAAETNAVEAEARRKCREKGLEFIVANDVTKPGCGFGTDTNRVTFLRKDGSIERLPLLTKLSVARRIVRECVKTIEAQSV